MARLANARNNHMTQWVIPAAKRLLIEEACKNAPTQPLGEIAHIEMGQSPDGDSCNEDGEGIPLIGGPTDLGIEFPETTRWTNSPTKLCRSGDIIVCVRATIGEPRWADGIYCLGRGVAGVRPIDKDLLPKFLFFIIEGNEQILRSKGTGTTFKTISKEHLASIQVPMIPSEEQMIVVSFLVWLEQNSSRRPNFLDAPPLPESLANQRRIVARIEELAARIEEARGLRLQAINEAEALILSSLSRIFDYDAGDKLPDDWTWQSLSDLLINKKEGLTTGPFGTLLQKSDIQLDGVPVLGIANVQANRFVPGFSDYISLSKANSLSSYKLEADDIVIARSGTVGRSCVLPYGIDPAPIMSTNLIRLRVRSNLFLPELLCRLFNGSRLIERFKDSECRGSTRAFFTQHILLKLHLPVPPLSEQRRIIAYLDGLQSKVDSLKQLQYETSAELDALLPSILDKAFKGEL